MIGFTKPQVALAFLTIIYVVGVAGLVSSYQGLFLSLTALNLALTCGVYIWAHGEFSSKFKLSFLSVFLIGLVVEMIGVNTGLLFGAYTYGEPLGFKILDTPVLIGINWFLLSFSSYGLLKSLIDQQWLRILAGATLMTALDYLIEPVAIALDFWSWEAVDVPPQNYLMWFVTAAVVHWVLNLINESTNKFLSFGIFGIQFVFFLTLNLFL